VGGKSTAPKEAFRGGALHLPRKALAAVPIYQRAFDAGGAARIRFQLSRGGSRPTEKPDGRR